MSQFNISQAVSDGALKEALKASGERYAQMTPVEKDSMWASQKIGYVVAESLPDMLDNEQYSEAGLQYMRRTLDALADEQWQTTSHSMGAEIRKLTTVDRHELQQRVQNFVRLYEQGLEEQDTTVPEDESFYPDP